MDRNTVIGILLITAIMVIWMYWFAPQPETPPPSEAPQEETQRAREAPSETTMEEDVPPRPSIPSVDSTLQVPGTLPERRVVIDTDLYTATLSTRGGSIRSFILKKYKKYDRVTPVQMIDTTQEAGALGMLFTTPSNHLVDTRALDFDLKTLVRKDTVTVTEAPLKLLFEASVGEGFIRYIYTFKPGTYEVELQVEQENPGAYSTRQGYEMAWYGGVPFTEEDPVEEARSTGAYARSGGEVEGITLDNEAYELKRLLGDVDWTAVKNKFFTAVLIPSRTPEGAELEGWRTGEPGEPQFKEDYTTRLMMPDVTAEPDVFRLYIGPMEYARISKYKLGLYDMVDYGWGEFITRPLARYLIIPAFHYLGKIIPNYGLVIIVFALIIKLLLYPLTKSSYTSMAKMRELQPKMEEIKEKYKDNPQKQQQAIMKLYKESGVNPMGGCLPMLLQLPILIALWRFFSSSIEIRQQAFLWAKDLSAPDYILHLPFDIPFIGGAISGFATLMVITMITTMRMQGGGTQSNPQMKMMQYIFPVMMYVIFNRLASGLNLYYLTFNLVTAVQQKWIQRHLEKEGLSLTAPPPNGQKGKKATPKGRKRPATTRRKK